jgi:hypothetical protein
MQPDQNLSTWVIAWGAIAAFIVIRHWRRGRSVGLLLTYVLCFAALHWLVPLLQLLPWFEIPRGDLTHEGLYQSTYAIAGFAIGVELLNAMWGRRAGQPAAASDPFEASRTIDVYLVVGLVLYGLSLAGVQLQLLSALVSTGSTLVAAAVGLKAWQSWRARQYVRVALWLASTLLFPLATVMIQGFLGYGFVAALIVLSLIATIAPTRVVSVAVGMLMLYLGLSVYVTYMRDRTDIREVVWGGDAFERRLAQIDSTVRNAELFDPWDVQHLGRIDRRLNQDHLIGAAVVYLSDGNVEYANGQTVLDAVIALIPRALWPDKPIVGGSGDLVSTYTGIRFVYGTSVGVGQVMELHINFASPGVFFGFILLGMLVMLIDRQSARCLEAGNIPMFALWYVPGLSILQIGGALAEVTATAGASAAVVVAASVVARRYLAARPMAPRPAVAGTPFDNSPEVIS